MDRITRFVKDVLNGWLEAGAFTLAAALAYYAIFAIAPLLLISIYLASLFLDRNAAVEGLTNEMIGVIGPSGSDAIKEMLDAAGTAQPQGWAGLVAIAVLLFAATGFVGGLQDALDKIWDAPPREDGIWDFIKTKLFSFTLVLAAAFLLLISLVLSTAMTALTGRFTTTLGLPEGIIQAVILIVNFLLAASVFAAIFKFVPSVAVTWRAAIAGGDIHGFVVRSRSLRPRMVPRTRSGSVSLRRGYISRALADMGLLLGPNFVPWSAVFSNLPKRGRLGARLFRSPR